MDESKRQKKVEKIVRFTEDSNVATFEQSVDTGLAIEQLASETQRLVSVNEEVGTKIIASIDALKQEIEKPWDIKLTFE